MSLNQRNLREVPIDLKLNNLDLSGKTPEFKTLPTRPRSHRYILFYTFAMESVKIYRFKTFWISIFARGTLMLFRCLNVHVKMFVLLRYCARMCLPRHKHKRWSLSKLVVSKHLW